MILKMPTDNYCRSVYYSVLELNGRSKYYTVVGYSSIDALIIIILIAYYQ